VEAIIAHKIKRVVIACLDRNPKHCGRAVELLEEAGIEVSVGVENPEAMELNESFFKWVTTKRPFVILKMAMTLDGKIATENGDSKYVTDTPARSRVQTIRRLADAIMVGGDTCRIDRPQLTVREPATWECQPLRLIASRSMDEEELAEYFPDGNAELVRLEENEDWDKLLEELGSRNIVTLLIEGGGELAASALAADAVDYVEFHIAPKLLGGRDSRPVLGGDSPEFMSLARKLYKVTTEKYGDDIAICGYTRE
jgi:diaminohydroxyphosphoribosylaminopyrimidine deaminase/5-amino-6-(5-phosphoribosylamino)uracil reductase